MRLRLNTKLRAALIAAVSAVGFTLPQAYAEKNWSGGANINTNWFYTNDGGSGETLIDTEDDTINLTAENSSNGVTANIATITAKEGGTLRIVGGNVWGAGRSFKDLTIETLKAGTEGTGEVFINTEQYNAQQPATKAVAKLNAVQGTLTGVDNYAILTLGTADSTINASGTLENLGNDATLTLNGTYTFDTKDASKYTVKKEGSLVWTDEANKQGFKKTSGSTYYVIKGAIEGDNFSVTTAGVEKESTGNYYFTAGEVTDYTKFYVNATTATLNHDCAGQMIVSVNNATVTVDNATFSGSINQDKVVNLTIQNGGTVVTTNNSGNGFVKGDVVIKGDSTLRVAGGHDAFGWGGNATKSVTLEGTDGHLAKMELNQTTGNSCTFTTNLIMKGYATVTSKAGTKGFNTYGGYINVSGVSNSIDIIDLRSDVTTTVAASGALEVKKMTLNSNDGTKVFTKAGEGSLTFSGSAAMKRLNQTAGTTTFAGGSTIDALQYTGGSLVFNGGTNIVNGSANVISNTIELTGGELKLGGTYDISGLEPQGGGTSYVNGGSPDIAEGNGFAQATGNLIVVHVDGGTLTLQDGVVFNYNAAPLTVGTDGVATLPGTVSYSALYVNNGNGVSYNAAWGIAQEHSAAVTSVVMADGTNIDMDKEGASIALTLKGSATVNATQATTISSITGWSNNTLTITGTGAVTLPGGDRTLSGTTKLDVQGKATANKIMLDSDTASLVVGATGDLILSGNSNLTPTKGTVDISGKLYVGHEIDLSNGSKSTGKITLHSGADVTVKDGMWMNYTSAGILLEEGAKLAITGKGVKFTGKEGGLIKAADGKEINYSASNDNAVIKNVIMEATDDITIDNQLTNVDLVTGEYTMTLSKTLAAGTGTLGLDGTFAIDAIEGSEVASYEGGTVADNGYKTSTTTRQVYTKEEGGVVTIAEGSRFMVGEAEVTLADDGTATSPKTTDYTKFYVNSGTETVSKAFESHEPTAFQLAASTTLQVDQSVAAAVRGANATSVVNIESNKVLTGTAQNVTIAGSGTYVLNNATAALGTGVALAEDWTGIVSVTGASYTGAFSTGLSHEGSWIELKGTKGYLTNQTIGNDLILSKGEDDWAFAQNDGNNGHVIVFTGTIKGDGNLGRSNGTGSTYTYEFSGDISNWTGQFISRNNDKHSTTFKLSGQDAMVVGATLVNKDTDFYVAVDTDATFNAGVDATKVTVAEGKTATFTDETTIGTIVGPGKVVVGGAATLTVTGSVAEGVKIEAEDGATIDGKGIDTTAVGIQADATATFVQGVSDAANGVSFLNEESGIVSIKNTGTGVLHYDATATDAKVTADKLVFTDSPADTVVGNELVVKSIENMDYAGNKLTLTHIDTETLESIDAYLGDVTLQNVGTDAIVLKDMSLLGTTVAVYQGVDEVATAEGSVTITESLLAGGGTLYSNLTIVANELGTTTWTLLGQAMKLGSTLTLDTADGLIQLDDVTMRQIAALENRGDYLELVLNGGNSLDYIGSEWFDGVFSRNYEDESGNAASLVGDYNVQLLDNGNWGIVKFSKVPEPTTGTLSLLALMALAARRRRK